MITRHSFPTDVERALTLFAELVPASSERDAMLRSMARETARFSDVVRPRPSICRIVEIAWLHHAGLEAGSDQREIWGDALCEALPFLLAEQPSPRWEGHGDARVFYDPEPTQTHRIGDMLLRWAWWGDSDPLGEPVEISLWRPYLDMIVSRATPKLQRAWCELCVLPRWQLSALVDRATFERFAGEASVEYLHDRIVADYEESGEQWVGARESPYVLGRLASLLGPPPDQETVCIGIEDTTQRVSMNANDRGEGFRAFTCWGALPGFSEQLTTALFADGPLADVDMLGYNDTDGTSFRIGCRSGLPFMELADGVAPWYRNPR